MGPANFIDAGDVYARPQMENCIDTTPVKWLGVPFPLQFIDATKGM